MSWFLFAVITFLAWGIADLFYKKGADENDKYSHLKTSMMVGVVMGLHAIVMLCTSNISLFGETPYDFRNIIIYLPVSLMYILSMTVGYFGLRYLELSISSPVQNCSGVVVSIMCMLFLGETLWGRGNVLSDILTVVGFVLMIVGVFILGVFEKQECNALSKREEKKYKIGFVAFLMPIAYCIIDSLGTFFDAYYLDEDNFQNTPFVNVTQDNLENVANTSYELTFLICAIVIFIFLIVKKQKIGFVENKDRAAAAVFETAGQLTYVYAMSDNAVIAAPIVASYCLVSVILSRIFLKEKLSIKKYIVVGVAILGIALMGVADGLVGDV